MAIENNGVNINTVSVRPSAVITNPAEQMKLDKSASEENVSVKGPKIENKPSIHQNEEMLEQKLQEAKDTLQTHFDVNNKKLNFSVHNDSDRMVVRVIDPESGETLKELPSEAVLKMVANIEKFQDDISKRSGLLFDEIV